MPRGRPKSGVRVSKKMKSAYIEEGKKTSSKRKRTIIPGPWTNKDFKVSVTPALKSNKSLCSSFDGFTGIYREVSSWNEKGWYPIAINLTFDGIKELVQKEGIDKVLAACEKGLSAQLDEDKKKKYGDVVLLYLFCDHSQREDPAKRFISVYAKTNKKHIEGFMATRKGELMILGSKNLEEEEFQEENSMIS